MAELTTFGYRPGNSLIHRIDPRFKLLFMLLVSIASLAAAPPALALFSGLVVAALLQVRLSLRQILSEIRFLLLLLIGIWTARLFFTPGPPLIAYKGLAVSATGAYQGLLICWRILLVVFWGLLFVTSTRSGRTRAAIRWLLKPVPFIPEARAAMMLSLLIRFIPLVFEQTRETSTALRARGIENRKNPLYRITHFIFPLLRRIFCEADQFVLALEARCFNEQRSEEPLAARPLDWSILGLALALGGLALMW